MRPCIEWRFTFRWIAHVTICGIEGRVADKEMHFNLRDLRVFWSAFISGKCIFSRRLALIQMHADVADLHVNIWEDSNFSVSFFKALIQALPDFWNARWISFVSFAANHLSPDQIRTWRVIYLNILPPISSGPNISSLRDWKAIGYRTSNETQYDSLACFKGEWRVFRRCRGVSTLNSNSNSQKSSRNRSATLITTHVLTRE